MSVRTGQTWTPLSNAARRLPDLSAPWYAWGAVLVACVGSRLATTITYIEDPDSLRFALSVADEYDVPALQPHFPGYPVFWFITELFAVPTGGFSASFSIVGGLATAGLLWALLRLGNVDLHSPLGWVFAAVVIFNPMIWLLGNRYMPDLLGAAWVLATFVVALRMTSVNCRSFWAPLGMAGTGMLAGLRLSYLPLLLIPILLLLWRSPRRTRLVAAGLAGTLIWLVPLILDTGLWTLIDVGWGQTTGHFTEFGGTVHTEADLSRRVSGFVQGLWADGLGAWWPGRHPLTAVVAGGILGASAAGLRDLWRRGIVHRRRLWLVVGCAVVYALWIFFFQNVVHKSRHVLPLVALLLPLPATGAVVWWRRGSALSRTALIGAALTYAAVTGVLVAQHLDPTAIAQAKTYVQSQTKQHSTVRIASVPLVNTYLRTQKVNANYLSVEDSADVRRLRNAETGRTLVVGTYASLLSRDPLATKRFYHNPYVNRMWPEVTVYVYEH